MTQATGVPNRQWHQPQPQPKNPVGQKEPEPTTSRDHPENIPSNERALCDSGIQRCRQPEREREKLTHSDNRSLLTNIKKRAEPGGAMCQWDQLHFPKLAADQAVWDRLELPNLIAVEIDRDVELDENKTSQKEKNNKSKEKQRGQHSPLRGFSQHSLISLEDLGCPMTPCLQCCTMHAYAW